MDCTTCRVGRTVEAHRTKAFDRVGQLVVIRGVPVDVCNDCGDTCLDVAVATRLDALVATVLAGPSDVAFVRYKAS
jgi:YgiT-type zinc finger domain-containing protein